ncbi:multidrug effflux MFS transporter [Ochrobactrum sp. GRS2]|nr:multidrug effflux MFS transporter [Ochrobactrum sp. GRS2]
MSARLYRTALVLGFISAIGPFAIDMYLPALPTIAKDLHANDAAVQMSLMVFFLATALMQMFCGPFSDIYGRKLPLYLGLALFAAGSVGSAMATNIEMLIFFRFIQGVGASAGMVVPRAIVRDLYTGVDAARLMSMLMLVFSISPILAPLTGSFIIEDFGWRGVFWAVLLAAILGLALVFFAQEETRPVEQRISGGVGRALRGYAFLIRDSKFIGLTCIGGFCMAAFFVYIANSSFIFIEKYGLTPREYSLVFSLNAISFFGVSQLNGMLASRYGLGKVVSYAVTGYLVTMVIMVLAAISLTQSLWMIMTFLFIGNGFLGLVLPGTSVLALDDHGEIAGTAAALLGTLQLLVAAAAMGLSSFIMTGNVLPMLVAIALCGFSGWVLTYLTIMRHGLKKPSSHVTEIH